MEVPDVGKHGGSLWEIYGNAQDLLVARSPEGSDRRFFKDRVAVDFLKE